MTKMLSLASSPSKRVRKTYIQFSFKRVYIVSLIYAYEDLFWQNHSAHFFIFLVGCWARYKESLREHCTFNLALKTRVSTS